MNERVYFEQWQVETLDQREGQREPGDSDQLWVIVSGPYKSLEVALAEHDRLADDDEPWPLRVTHTVRSVVEPGVAGHDQSPAPAGRRIIHIGPDGPREDT